ncbi:hypothetical protein D9R08_17210 [Rhodophyticola porphyridii]|uniref:Tetratricopeptide repeat protein n=2 Tax=Rhodophyticola porphyridii TaxID=1852017 RepID=A0A3L9XWL1_9RHOB|nr:hypothetical protein D9R08_17210 [Rhodophyticola porphyridii]
MNFVSSKIVGQESYKHLGPFLGDMLIDYADVAARAMELESSIAATQLAEEIYLIFLGRLSEDRFEAMIQRARAYSQTYRFDLARDCFERIVEEVESWTDAQVFSLSFLIEDILDPCIEFFQSQQDFDRQLDIYQLKLRKTVTQHSRPELSHLIPDVLPQMIFDIIEHQMEIWDQDDAEEKYDAARTFDDVEKNFGRRVREKLERLLLLNEVEL